MTFKRKYFGCKVDACGRDHFCKGYCRKHFERWMRHGDPLKMLVKSMASRGEPLKWLNEHKNHQGEECLIWPFSRHPDGRAQLGNRKPSRIMCGLVHGAPPTKTHEAAHSCGKAHTGCVHPKHLRWATPKENAADKLVHGTVGRGEQHGASKLTVAAVLQIRGMKDVPLRVIADKFGIAITTACNVRNGTKWTWLKEENNAASEV